MADNEQQGVEALRERLKKWCKLINYLPETLCDRDNVGEIEKLVQIGIAVQDSNILYEQAVKKWGADFQVDMMIEECAELIQSLCHYKRDKVSVQKVYDEFADVEIMSAQMRICFGNYRINQAKELKLLRLKQKIER